jgi:hypothetical protein
MEREWINVEDIQRMSVKNKERVSSLVLHMRGGAVLHMGFPDADRASLEAQSIAMLNENLVPFDYQ